MSLPVRLSIKLALHGCANRPFYHIVLLPHRAGRDDTPMEQLGTFDPVANKNNEKLVAVNFDRLRYWLAQGATPSRPVAELLGLSGFLPIHPRTLLEASRNQKAMQQTAQLATRTQTETLTPNSSVVETTPPPA